ncbi:hypothetical protein TSUD_46160 [Trifolium subterraneum]|nr:hypothetical protein TSUD_46160 [Trifolium subterraneum]
MDSKGNSNNHNVINDGGNNRFQNLPPVAPKQSGEGLPYAPENIPNPGDIWRWKVGKRISNNGNFRDRYLYLPRHPSTPANRTSYSGGFPSKPAVRRYLKEKFPHINIHEFFSSFSWNIPSGLPGNMNPTADHDLFPPMGFEAPKETVIPSNIGGCKAGNKNCSSLILERECPFVMPCEFCCAEPKFCRKCCCILCKKAVDSAHGGYSYIMCEKKHGDNICGHLCHLECAFRTYKAGTLGGVFDLDAEYFCWRCNGKTELISHVSKLLLTYEGIDSDDDVKEKMLNLGINLLRGSEKAAAKKLMSRIALAISKLKPGSNTKDIFNVADEVRAHFSGCCKCNNGEAAIKDESPLNHSNVGNETKDFRRQFGILKLESEIDQDLKDFRKPPKQEYQLAEEKPNMSNIYRSN